MKVMKFGGGCLKDASTMERVAAIVAQEREEKVLVVSAIFGITEVLARCLHRVKTNEREIKGVIRKVRNAHLSLASESIGDKIILDETLTSIEAKMHELERLLYGVAYTEELTDRTKAFILSFGERLSSCLLEGILQSKGLKTKALDADRIGLITDASFENATAILPLVTKNLRRTILPLVRRGVTPIITGYFGCTEDRRITTFGRNSSDYSAAVITRCIDASVLEIWKDVDGFMSADPGIVKSAHRINGLSYYEAAELSYFGARILHPRTVEPLVDSDIPIVIKNISDPKKRGTRISREGYRRKEILKSVTFNKDITVLKIKGAGVGYKPGIISEMSRRLSDLNINIYSIITSQTCINLLLDRNDLHRSFEALRQLSGGVIEKIETMDDVALIAVVGEGLLRTHGLAAKVFSAVAREKVNVEMISAGASEVAYYFIIKRKDLSKAIHAIHEEYLEKHFNTGGRR